MKNFKKITVLLMGIFILFSFVACSNDKRIEKVNGEKEDNISSNKIYDFAINIFGDTFVLPAELNEFKNNGWTYANNENPESKEVRANGYATCDVLKDGKRITLTVINLGTSTKKFADCKIGSIDCTFSSANDIAFNLAKKLSITKDATVEDITDKFGEATKTIDNDSGTTLRYKKGLYVYYLFTFNAEGKLTYVDIRNWKADDETTTEKVDLSFLGEYVAPDKITDDYADYIFKLGDKIYQLPTPVSILIQDGWTITNHSKSIPAGNEDTFLSGMKKGNNEITFTVKNFATGPVKVEEAMITGIFLESKFLNNLDFELSGGISFGMSVSDFKLRPYISQFTVEKSVLGSVEYSHFEPSNSMYLTFKDDKLVSVNFSKRFLK